MFGTTRTVLIAKVSTCDVCHGSGAKPGTELETCKTCNGSGRVHETRNSILGQFTSVRVCNVCGGRGQVVTARGIFSFAQTCPRCEGAGRVIEKPCKACHGTGRRERPTKVKIRVPAGVDTGTRLRIAGAGEAGVRGGEHGHLTIVIHVKPHEIFQREGDDLFCEVPVSFVQATLGADLEVPTLNGKAQLRVPPGTQPGTPFSLKGRGIKNVQGYGQGNLVVRVNVEVPTRLNAGQRAKLEEFAGLCDETVNPISQSFFEKAKNFFR